MRERRTLLIDSSIYKELSELATKVKNDSISNQLEIAVKEYLAKEKSKDDEYVFSSLLIPLDKRMNKLEEHMLDVLFRLRLDLGIVLNLTLPLSTNYITRTDKDILKKVMDEIDGIYEAARRKTVRQLEKKEGD